MSKNDFNEKRDEKDEKELDKHQEKSAEEKWNRDPLAAIVWASILIWAGIVLLAANLGAFDLISDFFERLPFELGQLPFEVSIIPVEGWAVFWVGAAVILILEVAVRLIVPEYRRPVLGTMVLSIIFLALGLGTWVCVLPLILIGAGVSILFRNLGKKE
jgi:uncharacterized membrane protein